jgi:hypothetical protein
VLLVVLGLSIYWKEQDWVSLVPFGRIAVKESTPDGVRSEAPLNRVNLTRLVVLAPAFRLTKASIVLLELAGVIEAEILELVYETEVVDLFVTSTVCTT